jgi:hypothetical protein
MNMIHKISVSKREMRRLTQEINLAEVTMANVPEFIDWSTESILFSRVDHPMSIPRPGHAAQVLKA